MQKNDRSGDDSQRDSVSDDSSDSPEPGPVTCMEPFMVRRLSCRTVQLPPLAFRQAEQYYCDRKPESDTVTVPPRPTTLPLRTPPLIAITSADTSSRHPVLRSRQRQQPSVLLFICWLLKRRKGRERTGIFLFFYIPCFCKEGAAGVRNYHPSFFLCSSSSRGFLDICFFHRFLNFEEILGLAKKRSIH
ncbi:uncharacterized protein [Thunnus thynnus]|uniref:uncharacterized protein isoform X1 n=1 Tax=Thunnus thynnus TaxID=8237 RepID=UPI003529C660